MSTENGRVGAGMVSETLDGLVATAEVVTPEAPSDARDGDNTLNTSPNPTTDGRRPRINAFNTSCVSADAEDDEVPITAPRGPAPPNERAYQGLAGDFVRLVEPHTEADPVALLIQFLIAFGNLIGRTAFFEAEAAAHHANLFGVLVGQTAKGRKGSSWEQIRRLADDIDSTWAQHRVQSGLSSGEGLIWAVRDPIAKEEPIRDKTKKVIEYQTIITDKGIDDKRLLVVESEFALVLKNLVREGNNLSAIVRQAWDTGTIRTLTKNSPATATGAHISIIGHITRDEVTKYLTETELANGFANRFLWTCVHRSKLLPHGGGRVDLSDVRRRLNAAVEFARGCGVVRRNVVANLVWQRQYAALSEAKPGLLGAVLGRAEAQVMRVAMLYALLDRSDKIQLPHLQAALALWAYCERSARYIFGESLGDRVLDHLLGAIRSASAGLTRNEIFSEVFANNKSRWQIRELLGRLLEQGLVCQDSEHAEGRGRPAERWRAT